MSDSILPDSEPNPTSTLLEEPGVLVAKKHHLLVRWSHWLNVPILLGPILSGISIYWASPIYRHKPDPTTGNFDVAVDIGIWIRITYSAEEPRDYWAERGYSDYDGI